MASVWEGTRCRVGKPELKEWLRQRGEPQFTPDRVLAPGGPVGRAAPQESHVGPAGGLDAEPCSELCPGPAPAAHSAGSALSPPRAPGKTVPRGFAAMRGPLRGTAARSPPGAHVSPALGPHFQTSRDSYKAPDTSVDNFPVTLASKRVLQGDCGHVADASPRGAPADSPLRTCPPVCSAASREGTEPHRA